MDMVLGPFTATQSLLVAGVRSQTSAIDEGDKVCTIHDGSWGGANAHTQANCEERTTAPTVMDCLHGIHWLQAAQAESSRSKLPYAHWNWPSKNEEWLLLKADVTKAHRRIKILPEEWKYQIAGSTRLALMAWRVRTFIGGEWRPIRLVYHIFPGADWGFVFVDDFCWLLRKSLAEPLTASILLFMLAFGCLLQHLVGIHCDAQPTTGSDGSHQT